MLPTLWHPDYKKRPQAHQVLSLVEELMDGSSSSSDSTIVQDMDEKKATQVVKLPIEPVVESCLTG